MIARTSSRWILLACLAMLGACSPRLDWREIRNEEAAYAIMMPARPATLVRVIDLNGTQVSMSMTIAEVDGITFAVGAAAMPDAAKAKAALVAMQAALVRNINGTIIEDKTSTMRYGAVGSKATLAVHQLHATASSSTTANEQARSVHARFIAVGPRVYQVIVMGEDARITRDMTDVYFSSLQLN